jgi:hypothetical protein
MTLVVVKPAAFAAAAIGVVANNERGCPKRVVSLSLSKAIVLNANISTSSI